MGESSRNRYEHTFFFLILSRNFHKRLNPCLPARSDTLPPGVKTGVAKSQLSGLVYDVRCLGRGTARRVVRSLGRKA